MREFCYFACDILQTDKSDGNTPSLVDTINAPYGDEMSKTTTKLVKEMIKLIILYIYRRL